MKNPSDTGNYGAGYLSIKDTGGTIRGHVNYLCAPDPRQGGDTPSAATVAGYLASAAVDTKGIVVGTGTTAESFEDYALDTKIANGTGAGELSYVASELHNVTWTGGTLTMADEQVRYFNNNSGGSIGVNEVGIIAQIDIATLNVLALMSRDVLGSTVTVPDTGQLKVTYTFSLVYPA